jgi:hypothetical protein
VRRFNSNLNSSVDQLGKIGNSNLDYQNASPDPTYFRKLPSYYSSMYGKDEGIFGALRRIMKMPKRVAFSFLANSN